MPEARVDGLRLYYHDQGEGEALILLHGLGSSSRDWDSQYPAFTPHYRVIAPDVRGFGRTERPHGPYSIKGFAADVCALLDQLGIKRFNLLGYSMGGAIAFELALMRPWQISRLVIVNCSPSFEINNPRNRFELYMRFAVVRLMGISRMARVIGKRLFPREDQREIRERMTRHYSENDTHAYLSALSALAGWSVVDRLPQISCPALLVSADEDYTPLSEKEFAVKQMPDARLTVINNSRHGTPIDQPEVFNRVVLDFLKS